MTYTPKLHRLFAFVTAALLTGTYFGLVASPPSVGAQFFLDKKFANCAALNKVYPGGVAKNKKVSNKGGATNYNPVVKPKIYKANSSKDRDKDGIACER
jgi:hypothetical protein